MKATNIILIALVCLAAFLRFYKIDTIPHGLYIDEVSIGYNAATILHSGKDEYGVSYPLFFKAFGEYKMPVAIYVTSWSIALFGKSEFAVRFPSAFFGTLTVLLLYFCVRGLFMQQEKKYAQRVGFVAAFLLAISPWHIQFSRGGFEANIALFLYVLAGILFLRFLQNKKIFFLFLSCLFFIFTVYTYNAYKLIAPITLVVVMLNSFQHLKRSRNKFGMTQLIGIICFCIFLLLPMVFFSLSPAGNHRFSETSAFATYANVSTAQKILHYPAIYLKNYFSYFSFPFLLSTSDGNVRHTVMGMGLLFRWELPFLLIGLYFLFRQRKAFFAKVLFFVLLLAPATAALTQPSPHALRSFLLVIPLSIISAYGVIMVWEKKSKVKKIFFTALFLFAVYESSLYLHLYYVHFPLRTAPDWGGEYKQLLLKASAMQKNYPIIVVSNNVGMIRSYSNFYNDTFSYQLVSPSWEKPKELRDKKILYITSSEKKDNQYLQTIKHRLIQNIYLPSAHDGIFVQFWEI